MNQNTILTVGQLIEVLSRYGPDLPVVITMNQEYESYISESDVKVFLRKGQTEGEGELYIGDVE